MSVPTSNSPTARPRVTRGLLAGLGVAAVLLTAWVGWSVYLATVSGTARRALADGRLNAAEVAADRWDRLSHGAGDVLLLKARIAIARGQFEKAQALVLRAKTQGAEKGQIRVVSAILAVKAGYLTEAEPKLAAAFDEPHDPDPQLDEALARVYLERFDMPRASAVIARWILDAPRDPKPYLWRAEIDRRVAGAEGELMADYREALRRDPNLAEARLGLAEVLRSSHRCAEAKPEYAAYLLLRPDDAAGQLGAARNAVELGEDDDARRHLDRAIALDPKNPIAAKYRADLALGRGDLEGARNDLARAVALDPYDAEIRYTYALTLGRLVRSEESKAQHAIARRLRAENEHLAKLQSRLVQSPDDRVVQGQVAQWLSEHGHAAEGARWAEKILKEQPDDRLANRILSDYYEALGNKGLANYYRLRAGPSR